MNSLKNKSPIATLPLNKSQCGKKFIELLGETGGDPYHWYGMSHGDELFSYSQCESIIFRVQNIQKTMVQMWVDFIQTGYDS